MFDTDKVAGRFNLSTSAEGDVIGDFEIHFQPIVSLGDNSPKTVGFEALGRKVGQAGPSSIYPFLESIYTLGLRPELEIRTLEQACRMFYEADSTLGSSKCDDIYITVNLHHTTLAEEGLLEKVDAALEIYPSARPRIRFEILEDSFPEETYDQIMANIVALNTAGYSLYQDDFGSDFESDADRLEELNSHLHGVKIDSAFWQASESEQSDILELVSRDIYADKVIVIEGVENDEQLSRLDDIQNTYNPDILLAQGWHPLLGPSLTPQDVIKRLSAECQLSITNQIFHHD